mmetsp:Transcript_12952/g.23349  ORF Transcript_12952/g.23349 Transcript_12952/m.23349 type:complete len:620 (+) Transcript_12952:130-1989(+)
MAVAMEENVSGIRLHPASRKRRQKKLSSIAMRALAVLESDDDGSSEDERDVRDFQLQEHQERDLMSVSRTTGDAAAVQSAIDLDEEVVATIDGEARITKSHNAVDDDGEAEPTGNGKDEEKSSSHHCARKSHLEESDDAGKIDETAASEQNRLSSAAIEIIPQINKASDSDVGVTTESDVAVRGAEEEPGDASPVADEDIVRPHGPTGEYNDILSSFLSTPFDDKAMITLHKLKEGIALKRKKNLSGKDSFQGWVSSHKDYVPIIHQKEFIKSTRERHSATTKQQESLQNAVNCDSNPISSAAISAEVASFLLQESQNLINSPLPSNNGHIIISNQQQASFQYPPAPSTQQPPTQNLPSHPTQQLQPSNYYGYTQQQNSYYPMPMLNSYNPPPQIHPAYQHINNGWQYQQYPRQFATPAAVFPPVPSITNAYNNRASTAAAPVIPPPAPAPPAIPKVATASAEIKLTKSNRNDVAKLPVAFGFLLDDDGTSKALAQIATQKWETEGKSAAEFESDKQGAQSTAISRVKRNERRNTIIPPSQSAGPEFPDGWTTKTFDRNSRKTTPEKKQTYKCFYSPVTKAKFRSMKGAHIFIKILKEPGINDDEVVAFNVFKSRGHKL